MPITAAIAVPHAPILVPEVGRGEEKKAAATVTALEKAARLLAAQKPDTIVLFSPHSTLYSDYFHISPGQNAAGDFGSFGAPGVQVRVDYDEALALAVEKNAQKACLAAGPLGEKERALDHGVLVPLYFLNQAYTGYKLVRIGLSGVPLYDHYRFGQCVAAACEGKNVCILASGDLSHRLAADGPYGFTREGPVLDAAITAALGDGDFGQLLAIDQQLAEKGAECGLRSFVMMAGALDGRAVQSELLSYEGPFGIGYAVATFLPGGTDEARRFGRRYERAAESEVEDAMEKEDAYVKLARLSFETYVKTGRRAALPGGLPPEMLAKRAGAFVSLHRFGRLRGCIGTVEPTAANVAEEILQNAVSAATADPRFEPVRPEELSTLEVSVDVLGEAEPVDSIAALDPKRYGVIVSSGWRRGLLLPDLDGVDTAQDQVDIARRKAGIEPDAAVRLERFEVVRHA